METDDGREFVNKCFNDFLKKTILKDIVVIFPQKLFLQNVLIVLLDPFLKEEMVSGWMLYEQKKINNRIQPSTNLTTLPASLKKNEGFVYENLLVKKTNKSKV